MIGRAETPADQVVTGDRVLRLGCDRCGYQLDTLGVDGACPECGMSIGDSIRAAGGWTRRRLRMVRTAGFLLAIAVVAWFGIAIPPAFDPTEVLLVLVAVSMAVHAGFLIAGSLLATWASSRQPKPRRVALVAGIGLAALVPALMLIVTVLRIHMFSSVSEEMMLGLGILARAALITATVVGLLAAWKFLGLSGASFLRWAPVAAWGIALIWCVVFYRRNFGGREIPAIVTIDSIFLTTLGAIALILVWRATVRIGSVDPGHSQPPGQSDELGDPQRASSSSPSSTRS